MTDTELQQAILRLKAKYLTPERLKEELAKLYPHLPPEDIENIAKSMQRKK
jgi:hypothetical protein